MKKKSDILYEVTRFYNRLKSARPISRVWSGFSGGADSTALICVLQELGLELTAVHMHHNLRGEDADEDARWCEAFCRNRTIPFLRIDLDVPAIRAPGESLEEAARRARLDAWRRLAGPDDVVALGHHLDDCLENVLLRLARGSNCSGLTGLRAVACVEGVSFIRPFLELRRADLETYLTERDIRDWRHDGSNNDPTYRRNAVRHKLLPLFRQHFDGDAGLVQALAALRQDADCLESQALQALDSVTTLENWRALHPALFGRVFRLWLARETGQDWPLRHAALERLTAALHRPESSPPGEIPLAAGMRVCVSRSGVSLLTQPALLCPRQWAWRTHPRLEMPEIGAVLTAEPGMDRADMLDRTSPDHEVFAAAALPDVLHVRAWRPGDRMLCFGARKEKKLQDVFTDDHVPREQRERIPVVIAAEHIIWLAGLRRGEIGRVGHVNEETVRLSFHQAEK